MSPRPKNIRKVENSPLIAGLKPIGMKRSGSKVVLLHFEEYESIRLCDYEMLTHQEACQLMGVSRPTFSRIYSSARQKIAQALVQGLTILIDGGSAYTDSEWFTCLSCGGGFNTVRPSVKGAALSCPICGSVEIALATEHVKLEKNKIMKKIAIPTRDNAVDNHFGHCEFYTILTVGDDNRILTSETLPSPQGCGCKSDIANRLEEMGVSVMLAGNMGQGALNKLSAHHIEVIRGCMGDIQQVAEDYLNGKITDSGIGCAAHVNGHHQCGGHHGEDHHQCHHEG